jgi:hypothetical protein
MRIFVHPGKTTPIATPVNDWLAKSQPLNALLQTAGHLAALEAEVLALLPPGIHQSVSVAGVKQDNPRNDRERTLVLHAAHSGAAARVRQIVPTLLKRLQQRGSQVTAIRVKVQPDADRRDAARRNPWHVDEAPREKAARMTPSGLESFSQLADSLEDSPLKQALKSLLAHHR